VDFDLSEEQVALQEVAREFLRERWSPDRMRRALDAMPAAIDDEVWKEIVSMGWLGVAAPEDAGGFGGDVMTAAVLAEEAGRGLLPGPFLSSLVSAIAIDRSGDASLRTSLLPELIDGRRRVTPAVEEPGGAWGPDAVALEAREASGEWSLRGTKILVPDVEGAELVLTAARTPHGLGFVQVPVAAEGLTRSPMRRLDAQSAEELVFEDVRVAPEALLGGAARAESTLRETYEIWSALCAADLLGSAQAVLEMTTQYATERVQFDRPIGSFQAVSHRLADDLVAVEIGRSLLYAACLALDERRDNALPLVSAAKAWLSDAAIFAVESALQIHGGVGFSWEYDVHLHMRRARCNAASLGDADHHRDRVAGWVERTRAASEPA
jgi:alkylation response protein AidB-like acyl-CoA dehydrogenase